MADLQSSSPTLLLLRHGQTDWNASGRWQGHADRPLTTTGRAQAETLAESLAAVLADRRGGPWSRLFASDLVRARATAAYVGEALALPVETDVRLRELDIGQWSGQTREEIEATDPELLRLFDTGDPDVKPGGGESRRALAERTRAFAAEMAARYASGSFLVVTHLGVVRALAPGAEPSNAEQVSVRAQDAARGIPFADASPGYRAARGPL